jgi:antitoxin HicB
MSRKDTEVQNEVEYYSNLPYTTIIAKEDDGHGVYYVARVIELPGLIMTGDTPEEAIAELEAEKPEFIELYLKIGKKMPEPLSSHQYSGNIVLRLPSSLHETLAKISQIEGVSLNQYMVSVLSRAVGRDEVLIKERKAPYRKK